MTPSTSSPRYRIEHRLGEGGGGEVFQAFDRRLRRRVALKRLSDVHSADDVETYERAWREAIHLAAVQHPNVITVYDFGMDAHGPFLIMELVEGETLEAVVARGAFPLEDFWWLAQQTLEGLAAAHHAGLLHRDLKPGNLMLKHGPTAMARSRSWISASPDLSMDAAARAADRFAARACWARWSSWPRNVSSTSPSANPRRIVLGWAASFITRSPG